MTKSTIALSERITLGGVRVDTLARVSSLSPLSILFDFGNPVS